MGPLAATPASPAFVGVRCDGGTSPRRQRASMPSMRSGAPGCRANRLSEKSQKNVPEKRGVEVAGVHGPAQVRFARISRTRDSGSERARDRRRARKTSRSSMGGREGEGAALRWRSSGRVGGAGWAGGAARTRGGSSDGARSAAFAATNGGGRGAMGSSKGMTGGAST